MRAARSLWVPAVLAALALCASPARADTPDSPPLAPARPDSSTSATLAPTDYLFRIYLERGPWIDAVRVEPWSMRMIRYQTPSGEIGYVGAHRLKSILDINGEERRWEVLTYGKAVGVGRAVLAREKGPRLPYRERRHYFLTEFGSAWSGGGEKDYNFQESVLFTGFGWMTNVSRTWALGPVVQFVSNVDDFHLLAVGLRGRNYMNDRWSLDGTLGFFEADYDHDKIHRGLPVFGEFGLTGWDAITFFTRFERHDYGYRRPVYAVGNVDAEVSEVALRFGIRVGPHPPMASIPAAVIGTLAGLSSGSD